MAHQVEKLMSYPNVPRKKIKFLNFLKNCMSLRNPADMERIWSVVQAANQKEEQSQQLVNQSKEQSDRTKRLLAAEDQPDSRQKATPDKKRRREGLEQENGKGCSGKAAGEPSNLVTCEQGNACSDVTDDRLSCPGEEGVDQPASHLDQVKFSWKKTIKRIVRQSSGREIPLRDLQRQVSQLNPSLGPLLVALLSCSFPPPCIRDERVSLLCLSLPHSHILTAALFPFILPSIRCTHLTRSRRRKSADASPRTKPIRTF